MSTYPRWSARLLRCSYSALFCSATPFILLRLWWRGIKAPAYRQRWQERIGFYQQRYPDGVIWFHAVSVGEAEAVFPLIRRLREQLPQQPILVTTTTPTGSERVQTVLGNQVSHVYLPYDLPQVIERFMRCFQPVLAVFLEKELWPNLFASCADRNIPLLIINARLSDRSAVSYRKIPSLVRSTLAAVRCIATQTESDRQNFLSIGATALQTRVLGNIKFDMQVSEADIEAGLALKRQLFTGRWVWIAASTHQGEEALLLSVYQSLKPQIPELLLLIAPRHPERFDDVAVLCQEQGLNVIRRSNATEVGSDVDVYLADSMGELKMLYAAADVAFVGGSLVAVGGHNVLEPAALGVAVLFGPYMFNFQAIADHMLAEKAAMCCANVEELGAALHLLYREPESKQQMAQRALAFFKQNQGATDRVFELIKQNLVDSISIPNS